MSGIDRIPDTRPNVRSGGETRIDSRRQVAESGQAATRPHHQSGTNRRWNQAVAKPPYRPTMHQTFG